MSQSQNQNSSIKRNTKDLKEMIWYSSKVKPWKKKSKFQTTMTNQKKIKML